MSQIPTWRNVSGVPNDSATARGIGNDLLMRGLNNVAGVFGEMDSRVIRDQKRAEEAQKLADKQAQDDAYLQEFSRITNTEIPGGIVNRGDSSQLMTLAADSKKNEEKLARKLAAEQANVNAERGVTPAPDSGLTPKEQLAAQETARKYHRKKSGLNPEYSGATFSDINEGAAKFTRGIDNFNLADNDPHDVANLARTVMDSGLYFDGKNAALTAKQGGSRSRGKGGDRVNQSIKITPEAVMNALDQAITDGDQLDRKEFLKRAYKSQLLLNNLASGNFKAP